MFCEGGASLQPFGAPSTCHVHVAKRDDFAKLSDRARRDAALIYRGSQYFSTRYTERLAEACIEPSVGSVDESYDNALVETINGL